MLIKVKTDQIINVLQKVLKNIKHSKEAFQTRTNKQQTLHNEETFNLSN